MVASLPVNPKPRSATRLVLSWQTEGYASDLLAQASKSLLHANKINEWKKEPRK